jgi:hypothetical protein
MAVGGAEREAIQLYSSVFTRFLTYPTVKLEDTEVDRFLAFRKLARMPYV